uniref:Transmembrane protein n=1 Tax=Romanomermis culicivorax TaxID=13658 RepID=A0A915IVL7_ROMCU
MDKKSALRMQVSSVMTINFHPIRVMTEFGTKLADLKFKRWRRKVKNDLIDHTKDSNKEQEITQLLTPKRCTFPMTAFALSFFISLATTVPVFFISAEI